MLLLIVYGSTLGEERCLPLKQDTCPHPFSPAAPRGLPLPSREQVSCLKSRHLSHLQSRHQQQCCSAPVGQHQRVVHRQLRGCEHADAPLLQLIAMALGTVKHLRTPTLSQHRSRGQLIDHAAGNDQQARPVLVTASTSRDQWLAGVERQWLYSELN